ncbi:hypothetical protein, partial [Thalassospira sp. MCCC 1A01428]|uniref:hypothetical protein n=1 Tax=Thalassospira sp. MCCC 1A01428 TaxID=1470575 RepID=UPI000A218909
PPPTLAESLVCHLHGTKTDLVDGTDISRNMMQTRAVGFRQSYQLMGETADTMHETYSVARLIRNTQSRYLTIEPDRFPYRRCKNQNMCQPRG